MTRTGAAARPDLEERAENLMEWAELHSRQLTIAAVAILLLGAGVWVYRKSEQVQAQHASESLVEAEQAFAAGNMALAQSDLEKLLSRYRSTSSGRQAQMLLGQVLFEQGQYEKGLDVLHKLVASKPPLIQAGVYNLIGAGYEQESKYAEAAAAYQKAADAAAYKNDRDSYLANAARALTLGGKTAEAIQIWTKLADDPASPANAEAKVRLGELEAKPVKQG